jgi:tetratricopeptide (TPR) repeat protein
LAAARARFNAGQAAFRDGHYEQALTEFEAAYALSPRPEFLITFAQTYRRLHRYREAITECERYLATQSDPALRRDVSSFLQMLRHEQAQYPEEPPRPAERPVEHPVERPPPTPPPVVEPTPPAATIAVTPSADEARRQRRRRLAIGLGTTAAVVVVGAAIAIGVVFGTERVRYPSTTLGTVSFAP